MDALVNFAVVRNVWNDWNYWSSYFYALSQVCVFQLLEFWPPLS